METLSKGQRLPLANLVPDGVLQVGVAAQGLALDVACFGLDANGKLSDERYMTFFNQPRTPCGGVEARSGSAGDMTEFAMQLARLPASIDRLVVTASIDGGGVMSQLQSGHVRLQAGGRELARFTFAGSDFAQEKAVMLAEIYRKDGGWRCMAVGQGFNGGLDALVRHFGGEVDQAASATPAAVSAVMQAKIKLEKRVEREAPQLVSLVKQAGVSLQKVGLLDHRAKVCLCLDISGSMGRLYIEGLVQRFAERILALGCKFDDDGEIDVFLFGKNVHHPAPMDLSNCNTYVGRAIIRHPLEGDTRYGAAMQAIRAFYFPDAAGGERTRPVAAELPVYVMFVTDGGTSDQATTEKQLRWASNEPIFWQFMGIGKGRKSKSKFLAAFADSDFPFLEKLDELQGRLVDNANYFSVSSPDEHSDEELYDLLMTEYPGWLKLARSNGLLT
ncbi:VWA domain-containing protein [Janthinobacterium sp. EB271-G4-7A]|uniref:VWA domain-containing protein n=1 Tax=Janthinobacterium sp. EB271-G4-7A TaxID=2775056 RepID=UPI001E50F123|nr:VWA domain-containing protein [Janthinobacterium sp. EB271-G4-7A]MCC7697022.1 VWA domain-containing protein [Janthinobacterium sp. EB271-G4-7A]